MEQIKGVHAFKLLGGALLITLLNGVTLSTTASAMTYRDNEVGFQLSGDYKLVGGSYTVDSFAVTSGEDPDHHIYAGLTKTFGSNGKMSFSIGRSGSKSTADWFNNTIPASRTTFNHTADKLNFAFVGSLKITLQGIGLQNGQDTFTFSDVGLAQGHAVGNNWWFGGKTCNYISNNQVSCDGTDSQGNIVKFVFLRGGNDLSTVEFTPPNYDTANWMGRLPDTMRLNQLMMPGSHDAGMSETHHCQFYIPTGLVLTQSLPISGQLASGSRYLDIRIDYDHEELVTYHRNDEGNGCNGQSFEAVLKEVSTFLQQHPTETAILKISHIRNDRGDAAATKTRIVNYLNSSSYKGFFYTSSDANVNLQTKTLRDVKGKIILVFDYGNSSDPKQPPYIQPSEGRFRYKDGFHADVCSGQSNTNITICDKYKNTDDYDTMSRDQISKWNSSAGVWSDRLFLLSWTLTPQGLTWVSTLAKEANGHLPSVLQTQMSGGAKKPNIVYIDYINTDIAKHIIQYNFQ